jgi:hypothetical protein
VLVEVITVGAPHQKRILCNSAGGYEAPSPVEYWAFVWRVSYDT